MSGSLESTGVLSVRELKELSGFPSENRLMKGPVAVIECIQKIPCNPCEAACPFEAIKVSKLIGLPELDEDKCIGCGSCIALCPGLAIFVVDYTFSEDEALISFPYEFLPLPKIGSILDATDRSGNIVTKGRIVKVLENENFDKTKVISIAVPKRLFNEVRGIFFPIAEEQQ